MRRRKCREHLTGALPDRPTAAPEPDDTVAAVDAEIASLPPALRAAVLLCEIEGLSRAEAAARLGVAEGTLSSRLAKARKVLAERLRRRGLAPMVVGVAAVPAALADAAAARADGQATGAVQELANGVLRTMLVSNLRLVPAAVLVLTIAAGGLLAGSGPPGAAPANWSGGTPAAGAVARRDAIRAATAATATTTTRDKDETVPLDAVLRVAVTPKGVIEFRFDTPGTADLSFDSREYRYALLDKDGVRVSQEQTDKVLSHLLVVNHTTFLQKGRKAVPDYSGYRVDHRQLKPGEEYYLVVSVRNLTALAKIKSD